MINWEARIEVFQGAERLGWTSIKDVATEALPRVGDRVSFWKDIASEELLRQVALEPQNGPTVTQVDHMVGRASTEVVVTIRASVSQFITPDLEELRKLKEGWLRSR